MKVVFVQTTPSQLDAPFYRSLAKALSGRMVVTVWNEYGRRRTTVDPELGLVPQFPDNDDDYPALWIDRRRASLLTLCRSILGQSPSIVVLQDQGWIERILLSLALRASGVAVGLRSDKNELSERARIGLRRRFEGLVVRACFDFLVPVSPLTADYYAWPQARKSISFPYCTDEAKYSADIASVHVARAAIRARYGIPAAARVFLSVVKFSERENPRDVITSFAEFARKSPEAWLLMVGSGPLLERERGLARNLGLSNVEFAGYVPYAELHEFFFAADVLIHLPVVGPWEISVPDALIAGRGVIATRSVGSATLLLEGELRRFLFEVGDLAGIARGMSELDRAPDICQLFEPARRRARECYSVRAAVARWKSWLGTADCNAG